MNFQLFKTAEMTQKITAPRVGDLVYSLRYEVAPSYYANESEHPELRILANALADHFMLFPKETKLFSSFRSKNPLEVVNREIVKFKASEIRALTENITESSIDLTDDKVRALVDIVMQAGLYCAWIGFTSNNLRVLILGDAEGLAFDELVKVAADVEGEEPAQDSGLSSGRIPVSSGRGRNKVRHENLNIDPENASASQGEAEAARLAYNCAFHALVTSVGMPLDNFHEPRPVFGKQAIAAKTLRQHALGMMIHRMDYHDYLQQIVQLHSEILASGQRPNVGGNPITPNPPYSALVGAVNHERFRRTSASGKATPSAAFVLTALGQSEDVRSSLQARDLQKRLYVFGKKASGCRLLGNQLSITGAHSRAAELFNKDPDSLKSAYEKTVVKGFLQNLLSIKRNGIYFSRYEEIIPCLKRPEVQARVRSAMARIINGMPLEADSLSSLTEAAQGLVDKEAPGLADLDKELTKTAKEICINKTFAEFASQMLLKLPLHFLSAWTELEIKEALVPVPDIDASRDIQIGQRTFPLNDAISHLMNNPEGRITAEMSIYNLFNPSKMVANTNNLFIVSRRIMDQDPSAPSLTELLKRVYGDISSGVIVAGKAAARQIDKILSQEEKLKRDGMKADLELFRSKNQKKSELLEAITSATPQELSDALFKESIMSITHATSADQAELLTAISGFISGEYNDSIPIIAKALSESFPSGKYNGSHIVQVDSNYNAFSKYEDAEAVGPEYLMGPGSGKYDHFGNSGAPIPPKAGAAVVSFMYECSEHFKLDQLEREHISSEYGNNKKRHDNYVARNYAVNPDTSADAERIEDIEKRCDELLGTSKKGPIKSDNILNKLGLSSLLSPPKELLYAKDLEERGVTFKDSNAKAQYESQVEALNRAKKEILGKVQDFFKTHSKSSIVKLLQQTPNPAGGNFDEFYYDALMVAISKKISTIFESDFEGTIINRYGRKEVASQSEGAEDEKAGTEEEGPLGVDHLGPLGAEMTEDVDGAPGATVRGVDTAKATQFERMEEAAAHSAVAGSRMMAQADIGMAKDYVAGWAKVAFARSGGLASHSLPGFIAEVLGKKDAVQNKDLPKEDRESIESHLQKMRLFESPDKPLRPMSDKLSYKYVPMFAHMKHRVRLSLGNQLFYKQANSALSRLLQSNKEGTDTNLPLDRKSVIARLVQKSGTNLIDPSLMARKLAEGDRIGDSVELAFSRMMTSMGDLKIDEDYNAWEKAALEYINKIYKRKIENKIDSLAVQISDRKFMKDLLTSTIVDFGAPAFTPDERTRLAGIGASLGKPKGSVSAAALLNATRSAAEFSNIMTKLGVKANEHDSVRKIIESNPDYRQAFEFELSTGVTPAQALETAVTMLEGPALKKELNKKYLRSTAPRSKYVLDRLLSTQTAVEKLDTWKQGKESAKRSTLGKSLKTMSMAQLITKIKDSTDVGNALAASLSETYGEDRDPDFSAPSEINSMAQDMISIIDGVFDAAEDGENYAADVAAAHSDIGSVAESDENDQRAEPMLAYAVGSALSSLIGQECSDNMQVAMLMHATIPSETLAKTFSANDTAVVRSLAAEFRLDHPRIRDMIESATDLKLSKPETIQSDKLRTQLAEGGVTPDLRRSIRANEASPMYASLLNTAKKKIEDIAQLLLSAEAEANTPALRKLKIINTSSIADGGVSNLLGKGQAILSARTVLDSIRADNVTMYQAFADNLDRKVVEWISSFSSKFPKLEQAALVAINRGLYVDALSSSDLTSTVGTNKLPLPLQKIGNIRVDIEKKKKYISDLRSRIASSPTPGTVDFLSWQIELRTIEQSAQQELSSTFPMTSAQIVTEQLEEASVAQDDEKSVEPDEIRRREAALDKIKASVSKFRDRSNKADKVPASTQADALNAATMLFKTLVAGRKTATDAYDSKKLEDIDAAIMRATTDIDSMDKVLIGTGNSSVVARLVAAIDDDSVLDISFGAKVVLKEKVQPKKPDVASFSKAIANAKIDLEMAISKASAAKDTAAETSVSNAMAFVSMFDQAAELIISDTSSVDGANRAISGLLKDVSSGREISEDYLRDLLEDLSQNGISSKRRLPDYVEIVREPSTSKEQAEPFMEVTEDKAVGDVMSGFDDELDNIARLLPSGLSHLSSEVTAALTAAINGLSPSSRKVAPNADIASAIKDLKILDNALRARVDLRPEQIEIMVSGLRARGIEIGEMSSTETPMKIDEGWLAPNEEAPSEEPIMEIDEEPAPPEEIADEDIELIDEPTTEEAALIEPASTPPVAAEVSSPAAAPAQPALPGVITPAKAAPSAIDFGAPSPSAESTDALDRIIEEIYSIDDILVGGGVEGPTHEALMGIESRLSAAKASKASIGDIDQLIDVLDRAMAVSDEVKSRDVSEFQSATPASLAALIEGVNNILMPKKAQRYMPAFVKMGDSWTILT